MAKKVQNLAIFGQNSHFWVFLPISSKLFRLLLLIPLALHCIDKYIIRTRNLKVPRRTIAQAENEIAQNRDGRRIESGTSVLGELCSRSYQCDSCYEHKHVLRLHNNSLLTLFQCHQLLWEFNTVRLVYRNLDDNHINAIKL